MPLASFCTQHCVHYPRDNGIICCLAGPGSMLLGCLRAFTQPDDGARPIGASSRLPPLPFGSGNAFDWPSGTGTLDKKGKGYIAVPACGSSLAEAKKTCCTSLGNIGIRWFTVRATHLIGQAALEHWLTLATHLVGQAALERTSLTGHPCLLFLLQNNMFLDKEEEAVIRLDCLQQEAHAGLDPERRCVCLCMDMAKGDIEDGTRTKCEG
eukprot:1137454-Pelagomonas_calceolata.AAC.5